MGSKIDNYLFGLLTPNHQKFSITNTRNWLDALQTELNAYQYKLEERVKKLNPAKPRRIRKEMGADK
ncbi:MAG: hypothetical protein KME05_19010 [Gloeocapsa sp. UFS-A4-WI-NPMV-4B04]|jgi:hypothetical protein|nr:hypothetical protein [Gloeocapsa sp. UFS-A4-WI-NPMV-4B04]